MQSPCWRDWRSTAIGTVLGTSSAWNIQDVTPNLVQNIPAILPSSKIESARSKFIKLEHRAMDGSKYRQDQPGFGLPSNSQKLRAIIIYIVVQFSRAIIKGNNSQNSLYI
jgi:hypothetical protein